MLNKKMKDYTRGTFSTSILASLLLLLLMVTTGEGVAATGRQEGCGAAVIDNDGLHAMCCEGKNNSCVSNGPRQNSADATTCFCDSDCTTFGDCCLDYDDHCAAVDCQLSEEWGEWSDCDAQCGPGMRRRYRQVVVEAQNGGRRCSKRDAVETARCTGTNCKLARTPGRSLELKETARIIPSSFAAWRHNKRYDPFQDIRRNLFQHYGDPTSIDRPSYCARYEVTEVSSTCRKMSKFGFDWVSRLTKGASLCVECQSFAMKRRLGSRCRGHGVYRHPTSWTAVAVPGCHGKWRLMTPHTEQCDCQPTDNLSFSFV